MRDLKNVLFVLVVVFALWLASDALGLLPNELVPPLARVLSDMAGDAGFYLARSRETAGVALLGLYLAVMVTIVFGVFVASSPRLVPLFRGIAGLSQTIPVLAIAPVIFFVLGFGLETKAFVAFLICYFPLLAGFLGEFERLSGPVLTQAQASGLRGWSKARHLYLPAGLVGIGDGMRVAAVLSVVGAAIAEIILPDQGLGRVVMLSRVSFNEIKLFGAVICLMALGLLLAVLAEILAIAARFLVRYF